VLDGLADLVGAAGAVQVDLQHDGLRRGPGAGVLLLVAAGGVLVGRLLVLSPGGRPLSVSSTCLCGGGRLPRALGAAEFEVEGWGVLGRRGPSAPVGAALNRRRDRAGDERAAGVGARAQAQ
jgi:hypothetical protein